jgi:hypothetical protein
VKLHQNNVAEGSVSMTRVYEAIKHAQKYLQHDHAGYRRMRTILIRNYNIQIPR